MATRRRSRQREFVLQVIRGTNCHPTATWIYEQVKSRMPGVSLGTIYRNLKLLQEEGIILELDYGSGLSRFDGNPENHYHFRCDQCGCIFDMDKPADREMEREVAQRTGFVITCHRLEFRGLCAECLKMVEASPEQAVSMARAAR